jgi:fatty acid desaturase
MGNADFPELTRRPDLLSALVVVAHLALALSPLLLATALPVGWVTVGWVVVFGLLMNGILNLLHESAHLLVFRRRALNAFLGGWVIGPLLLADTRS